MKSVIEFRDVHKRFGDLAVLDGLSFAVGKGEIVSVIGPSGTGKSVTLKHIVGLIEPDSGEVAIDPDSKIGYLFQSGALLAWMTVYDNVALPLRETTKLGEDEIDRRVRAALESVEMLEAAERYPSEISGGMQKRAGLARSIVRDADIVLYDEPTSGLDPVTSKTINDLIVRLNRERGITSVIVTHDLGAAVSMSHRILMLKDGRAVEYSTASQFVHSANPFVREMLDAVKGVNNEP